MEASIDVRLTAGDDEEKSRVLFNEEKKRSRCQRRSLFSKDMACYIGVHGRD
jgi:hypothetical protein